MDHWADELEDAAVVINLATISFSVAAIYASSRDSGIQSELGPRNSSGS